MKNNILITAFEPFAGRTNNGSMMILEKLKELANQADDSKNWQFHLLPVVYNDAAAKLVQLADTIDPDFILSLGEGDHEVRWETQAKNLDNCQLKDNAGNLHWEQVISPNGPATIEIPLTKFGLPNRPCFRYSEYAGEFVCNNLAYLAAYHSAKTQKKFGFIHVPQGRFLDDPNFSPKIYEIASEIYSFLARLP